MIQVENVSYRYTGNREETLRALNFTIPGGSIFGFLGPSGSGKSTTQKILMGLLTQYSGRVSVAGFTLDKRAREYYKKIGVAFEFPHFYEAFSARENLQFYMQFYAGARTVETRNAGETWLKAVGLWEDKNKKVGDFSKGMKMRLNFCRALQHNPDILFLDEPTSGLDPANARVLKDLILEQRKLGKCIFLTTHDMTIADQLCDRLAILHRGEIIAIDAPEQLKTLHGKPDVAVELADGRGSSFPLSEIGKNGSFREFLLQGEVKTIHSQEATLEQVFLQLTGAKLA